MTREGWGQNIYRRMLFNSRRRLESGREGGGEKVKARKRLEREGKGSGGGKGMFNEFSEYLKKEVLKTT